MLEKRNWRSKLKNWNVGVGEVEYWDSSGWKDEGVCGIVFGNGEYIGNYESNADVDWVVERLKS